MTVDLTRSSCRDRRDEDARDQRLAAIAEEIRARLETPRSQYVDEHDAFAAARARIGSVRDT